MSEGATLAGRELPFRPDAGARGATDDNHGQGPARRIQRWRHRHPHYGHGAGAARSARRRCGGAARNSTEPADLRLELCLRGAVLEQPPSPPAHRRAGRWPHPLGQFRPAVLALAHPGGDGVDGAESCRAAADRCLRRRPAAAGVGLLSAAKAIIHSQGANSVLASALGSDFKGKLSPILYIAGIGIAFFSPWTAIGIYALVAILWLVPDRRIVNALGRRKSGCRFSEQIMRQRII